MTSRSNSQTALWPLTLFYDGACPLCKLEMDRLRQRDTLHRLAFIDISAPGFDPWPLGATLKELGALIHGLSADGEIVKGAETLRLAYRAVGLGHFALPTELPLLKPVFDRAYAAFARNRYGISRLLAPAITAIEARRALKRTAACAKGACPVPQERSTTS